MRPGRPRLLRPQLKLIIRSGLLIAAGQLPALLSGQAPARYTIQYPHSVANSVLNVPATEMRATLAARYRLKPDRRFLGAVAEIHHLLTGEPFRTIRVTLLDGAWVVEYGDVWVGELPDLPGYRDAATMLGTWAAKINGERPLNLTPLRTEDTVGTARAGIDGFFTPELGAALRLIDQRWAAGERHPESLLWGARGLVALALQSLDRLEIADLVATKALAATVVARTLTATPLTGEEALLAYRMGYATDADALAGSLPENDPVRLYLERATTPLRRMAAQPGALALTRFLALSRITETATEDEWSQELSRSGLGPWYRLGILKTGLDIGQFETDRDLPPTLATASLIGLWAANGARDLGDKLHDLDQRLSQSAKLTAPGFGAGEILHLVPAGLIQEFENDVKALEGRYTGPFLDAETYAAYLRGHFYSAIYIACLHDLDGLASLPAAEEMVKGLTSAPPGVGADLHQWFSHLTQSQDSSSDGEDLINDTGGLRSLGEPPLLRTFEEIGSTSAFSDPRYVFAAENLARRLDSRVEHLQDLAQVAYGQLLDVPLAERYYTRVVALAGRDRAWLLPWFAGFRGDTARVSALLQDSTLGAEARLRALTQLASDSGTGAEAIEQGYRLLLRQEPDNWDIRHDFIADLEERKQYAVAEAVAKEWLDRHDASAGFDYIFAATAMARLNQEQGRANSAWTIIQPVLQSQQGGAMGRGALILEQLGRADEALELGRAAVARYPGDAWLRGVLTEIHWRERRYGDAAELLSHSEHLRGQFDWRGDLGAAFLRVFGPLPLPEADSAFAALSAAGIDQQSLGELAIAASQHGRNDLAFRLESQLEPSPGSVESLEIPLSAYGYLKTIKGPDQSLRWLRERLPPGLQAQATLLIYRDKGYDLFWDLIDQPDQTDNANWIWLMRAAAFRAAPNLSEERVAALNAYYQSWSRRIYFGAYGVVNAQEARYFTIGRYLLGLEKESTVISLATAPDARCEVAFYVGLKAQSEGRFTDASDWFRIAVETEQSREGEYVWAKDQLYHWMESGRSLTLLQSAPR